MFVFSSPAEFCKLPSNIEDYGIIGDGETVALVDRTGSLDWLCWPCFDSDACFAALLGDERNGHWRIAPADKIERSSPSAIAETASSSKPGSKPPTAL